MSQHLFTLGLIVPLKEELDEVYRVLSKQRRCPEATGSDYFYDLDSGVPQVRLVASVMGDMGPVAASTRTSRMLQLFQPSVVNVLGIAGALDDECRLGDVVVAREVCEYLKDSKAEDREEQGAFRFKYSGAHWPLAARFSQAVTNFSLDSPERYAAWKEACIQARNELGLSPNTLLANEPTERLGHVASGDTVGASKAFSVELLGIDRKFLALEMEAAGVARACHENHTDWLVIRGISDFADERKKQLDSTARGGYRKLAARSAAEYLRWFIRWLADGGELEHFFRSHEPSSRRQVDPALMRGVLPKPVNLASVPSYMKNPRPSLKEFFVGRAEDIWSLHEALYGKEEEHVGSVPAAPQTVLLHALGGFGKTRLAVEYAHRFGPRCYPGGVFWVDASLGADQLEEQFHGILRKLPRQFAQDVPELSECRRLKIDIKQRLEDALEAAAREARILYVVDDVPEPGGASPLELSTWCPVIGKVHLLVTSRHTWFDGVTGLPVSLLTADAAVALLKERLREPVRASIGEQAWHAIAKWVEYHPLALDLLNKTLQHKGFTPDELLRHASTQRPVKIVDERADRHARPAEPRLAPGIAEAFEISYQKLSTSQQRVARLIAQLSPAPVPWRLLEALGPEVLAAGVLSVLQDRHFVTPVDGVDGIEMSGSMHQLLADFLRGKSLKPVDELRQLSQAFEQVMEDHAGDDAKSWPLMNACLPHAESIVERLTEPSVSSGLARLVGKIQSMLGNSTIPSEIKLGLTLGRMLVARGLAKQAAGITERVLRYSSESLGAEHLHTLIARKDLAEALHAQAEFSKAEQVYEELLAMVRRLRGEENWLTLTVRGRLASLYLDQGRLKKARREAESVLGASLRALGEEDEETLLAMARVAVILRALGRLREARKLQEQVLELTRKSSKSADEESPATVEAMSNLALTLYTQRKLSEARKIQERVLHVRRQSLGAAHPRTLTAMDQLAETLRELEILDKASEFQKRVVETLERLLGKEHPDTLKAMDHLAVTLRKQGHADEAKRRLEQVVAGMGRSLGAEHPTTLTALGDLAETLYAVGELDRARGLQQRVLDERIRVLGEDHPDTFNAIIVLTDILRAQGEVQEAQSKEKQTLKVMGEVLGEEHPDTLRIRSSLALARLVEQPGGRKQVARAGADCETRGLGRGSPRYDQGEGQSCKDALSAGAIQ